MQARVEDNGGAPLKKKKGKGGKFDEAAFLKELQDLEAKSNEYYTPYNTIFQIARTAVFRLNFSNFCYQWLDCAHVVLSWWIS
jgi:hypothetical protein